MVALGQAWQVLAQLVQGLEALDKTEFNANPLSLLARHRNNIHSRDQSLFS